VVNYLKACPLPEAAAAVAELEKIDPEAVRRAATLAGLAAVAASAPATAAESDDDGGDGGATSPAAVAPTAEDSALAATIAPVLADEDATDGLPSIDPAAPQSGAGPDGGAGNAKAWRWAFWAADVLLVAVVSRSLLKPTGRPGPSAR
jgi:hypothetical protein